MRIPDELVSRVPPGQHLVNRLPVLHYGPVPQVGVERWDFRCYGLVEQEVHWSWAEFEALPARSQTSDIHCVTSWSMLDTVWEGVPTTEVMKHVRLKPEARYVLVHAENNFTANLSLDDFLAADNLFAWGYDNGPLRPEHGAPLRLVVPSLYFWKSAKWVRGLEFLDHDVPGFWERAGYHMHGDPWKEERYGGRG